MVPGISDRPVATSCCLLSGLLRVFLRGGRTLTAEALQLPRPTYCWVSLQVSSAAPFLFWTLHGGISALAYLQAGIPAVADLTTSTCWWFLVWTPRAKHATETRGPGLTTLVCQNQHVVSSPSSSSQQMAVPCGWLLTAASSSDLRSFCLDPKPHVQLMAEMANCGKYG